MAINYAFILEGNTLYVRTEGYDESLAEVQAYNQAVIAACVAGGHTRVLCDERALDYRLGTIDTFAAAEFVATQGPHGVQLAVVCSAHNLPDANFWEDVAINRGVPVRVFQDIEAARHWLATGT